MKMIPLLITLALFPLASAQANDIGGPGRTPSVRAAEIAPPQPPITNPHTPQSPEDKRRVDFAVSEIHAYYGPGVELRHPHVIPWSFQNFQKNRQTPVTQQNSNPNVIVEAQTKDSAVEPMPPHSGSPMAVGPALQPDEYMVHVYARFRGDPAWYHLDVILTEDAAGNPIRRRFFRIPMPPSHGQLPPGVVC